MISSSLFVVSFGEDPAESSEHAVIKQLPIKKSKKTASMTSARLRRELHFHISILITPYFIS
jgi:hypothetical protein